MHNFVKVAADIDFGGELELHHLYADAARVFIDSKDYGYVFDTPSVISCPEVTDGSHKVELVLYPSSYNKYGPHRHYEGDRHMCSPCQFGDKKVDFCEWSDAPDIISNNAYSFIKFGI